MTTTNPFPPSDAPFAALGPVTVSPEVLTRLQAEYVEQATALWNSAIGQVEGHAADPRVALKDRRFAAEEWQKNPMSAYMAGMYLLNARMLTAMADQLGGDPKTRERIRFAVEQWVDMASPSNYLALNPEALHKAVATGGESLAQGLALLLHDVRQGHLSQTDESRFEVGRNVGVSPGSVVFENDIFQLLEYSPLTAEVYEKPLLIVPPCINKFYILDLQPENSFVRYAVSQGHRVFLVSWRNADESMSRLDWDDYIERGAIKAIDTVSAISGSEQINTLGFCVGGTILANALSVLAARGRQASSSVTLLTAFLDFADTGVLDVFIDEASVRLRELTIGRQSPNGGGLLRGQELASTFSFLRPNDLVWNYVVGNYLKGETPPAFDLLYWNSDGTNLPGPMYCTYLRHGYLQNDMRDAGRMTVCGAPLDFRKIEAPAYLYASREDHIVPWKSAYLGTSLLGGSVRFVLGASGHIAGVVNPPAKKKRSHWVSADPAPAAPAPASRRGRAATAAAAARSAAPLPATGDEWFATATEVPGSWWDNWSGWLAQFSGARVKAPARPGNKEYPPIEPAPGRYVKQKA